MCSKWYANGAYTNDHNRCAGAQLNAENEALLILWNEERDRVQLAADHKQRAEQAYDKFYISLTSSTLQKQLFHDVPRFKR